MYLHAIELNNNVLGKPILRGLKLALGIKTWSMNVFSECSAIGIPNYVDAYFFFERKEVEICCLGTTGFLSYTPFITITVNWGDFDHPYNFPLILLTSLFITHLANWSDCYHLISNLFNDTLLFSCDIMLQQLIAIFGLIKVTPDLG